MATTDAEYLEATTLKQILNISDEVMDHAMGIAYQLYRAGRFADAETVCKGLLACDHKYWWSYSLHASVLRQLGRDEEALAQVLLGLKYEPQQPKLLLLRSELLITSPDATPPIGPRRLTPQSWDQTHDLMQPRSGSELRSQPLLKGSHHGPL